MLVPLLVLSAMGASRLRDGLSWSGQETLRYVNKDEEIDETHRFKVSFRVSSRQNDKWIVERKVELLGSRIMDIEMPAPPKLAPDTGKETVSDEGIVLDSEPFDEGRFHLDRLTGWWLPANAAETWGYDLEKFTLRTRSKARVDFKLQRDTGKLKLYTLALASEEPTDISATGKIWFDVASGRVLTADIVAKQARIPGGTDRATITITYTDSNTKRSPSE
jgi:hypothetical protein